MSHNNSNGSHAAWARGFVALWAALAMGLGSTASPAKAAPFAYVTNEGDGTVSVIDTATNTVVGTPIPVGSAPTGVAVTPDGKHVYVTNLRSNDVSVIETTGNTVVAAVAVGLGPEGIAVTPDGKHVYVAGPGLRERCRD
jgi:YVTN family beta-propeller protein